MSQPTGPTLYCSHCGKSNEEVKKLIAERNIYICDGCVQICVAILRKEGIDPSGEESILGAGYNTDGLARAEGVEVESVMDLLYAGGLPKDRPSYNGRELLKALVLGLEEAMKTAEERAKEEAAARAQELEQQIADIEEVTAAQLAPLREELEALKAAQSGEVSETT